MEKLPCSQCAVSILSRTAERNGGLCVPCAKGTRATLEADRLRYRAERERLRTDPFRIYWSSLLARVHATEDGYSRLPTAERHYFSVALVDGEVQNGGFGQYFYNSSSDHYQDAVAGFEEIGALASLDLLLRAKQVVFGFGEVPAETSRRRQKSARTSGSQITRLDRLDRLFWADPDDLSARAEAFLLKHGLVLKS